MREWQATALKAIQFKSGDLRVPLKIPYLI